MQSSRWRSALCWMGVGAATLAAGVGGWNALHRPAKPWATGAALLRVDLPWTPLDDEARLMSERRLWFEHERHLQAELLISPNVLSGAAAELQRKNPNLLAGKADPIEWLGGALRVEEVAERLLAVSMPGESREHQALIVNAVVEEYLSQSKFWQAGASKSRTDLVGNSLESYRQDLAIKRRSLREDTADPARQASLRDEIGVLEEVARRMALAAERLRLERDGTQSVTWVAKAHP